MLNGDNIRILLSKMTDDMHSNVKKIKSAFGSIDYTDEDNQSILHILVDNKFILYSSIIVNNILYAFLIGLVLAIVYKKYNNIIYPILVHISANLI